MVGGVLENRKAQYLKDARGVLEGSKYKGEKVVRFIHTRWENSVFVADWKVVREYARESIVVGQVARQDESGRIAKCIDIRAHSIWTEYVVEQ